ncbi:MAG: chemotaxis protein CheA [Limisphaera sp.]|nr:chemotaxis protein CheA [Limisphaera sp.]
MADPNPSLTRILELCRKLAFEAAFVRPGSDDGLLPLNNLLMEARECLNQQSAPGPLTQALQAATEKIEEVFQQGGLFNPAHVQWFQEWAAQLQTLLQGWAEQTPEEPEPSPALALASPPQTASPTAIPFVGAESGPSSLPDAEPALQLAPDVDVSLLREFLTESAEHLQNIEQGVLALEENPQDRDTLNAIFRAFHTFKGGAGFLDLQPVKELAHDLESLLDAARRGDLVLDAAAIQLILEGSDTLKAFVREITARLQDLAGATPIVVPIRGLQRKVQLLLTGRSSGVSRNTSGAEAPPSGVGPGTTRASGLVPSTSSSCAAEGQKLPVPGESSSIGTNVAIPAGSGTVGSAPATGYVKVDTVKLDTLIDLVGELVIAESMVLQDPQLQSLASGNLARNLAQLRRITSDLQRTAMSLRMVPVRATFQKLHRLVRDLALRQKKQVQLCLSGEDTELDRNIVEALYDPLVHMIRNAVDHGIEPPEARRAAGKPVHGTIHLRAFHQGGNIVIQVEDDGRGLDKNKLIQKAKEKGLLKSDATLTDLEAYNLIFAPGFSTADQVTEISGRGVGMDVVRKNIEKLRGKIEIQTQPGLGTTFTIYLPLTLAIIDGLIVSVGDKRYIIPTLTVRESLRPRPEMVTTVQQRGEMINVRGRLTPLVRLHRLFGHEARQTDPTAGIVVVVESGSHITCLLVDELLGKQEVVIKSLGAALRENPMLAGGAVLGDGRVGLILNVDALVRPMGTDATRTWN